KYLGFACLRKLVSIAHPKFRKRLGADVYTLRKSFVRTPMDIYLVALGFPQKLVHDAIVLLGLFKPREVAALVNVSKHRGPEHPVCLLRRGFRNRVLVALDDQNRTVEFPQGLAEIVRLAQIDPQIQTYVGVKSSFPQLSR